MGDFDLESSKGEDIRQNAAINAEGGPGPNSQADMDKSRLAEAKSSGNHATETKPPGNPADQLNAGSQEKSHTNMTFKERLEKRRKELGKPPVPRIPDREDELEKGDIMLHSGFTRYVIRRGNTAVKYGDKTILCEAEAMQFAKDAGIPVPRIISFGKRECDRGHAYIEMEYIEGSTLEAIWDDLDEEARLGIAHQLRDILDIMRSLPPPPNFIGGFELKELRDYRHYDIFIRPSCRNEEEFNAFLTEEEQIPAPVRRSFRRNMGNRHKVVFSHCDLAPRNIMVRDKRIVALIDWEASGWYPEYWEYVKFMHTGGKDPGWQRFVDEVFTVSYDEELVFYTGLLWYQDHFDSRPEGRTKDKKEKGGEKGKELSVANPKMR